MAVDFDTDIVVEASFLCAADFEVEFAALCSVLEVEGSQCSLGNFLIQEEPERWEQQENPLGMLFPRH